MRMVIILQKAFMMKNTFLNIFPIIIIVLFVSLKHTAKEQFGYGEQQDEHAAENLLKIAVYFQTLNVQEITEIADITVN